MSPVEVDAGCFVLASVVDITARREPERTPLPAVTGQREFERLIADMSVQFINLPPDGVDAAMREALRRIGEALDLDRCTFFRIQQDGTLVDPVSWKRDAEKAIPDPIPAAQRFPWALQTLLSGELVSFASVDEVPNPVDRAGYRALGIRSAVTVPLVGGRPYSSARWASTRFNKERAWHADEARTCCGCSPPRSATCWPAARAMRPCASRMREVVRLRDQLARRERLPARRGSRSLGHQQHHRREPGAIPRVLEQVEQVAATAPTVLLLGETGTGKELFALRIHGLGSRRDRPMVRLNCAALPATLVESELFAREKRAFTPPSPEAGRFEQADDSTLFLDEIGDLPPEVQAKLLRILQDGPSSGWGAPPDSRRRPHHRRHPSRPGAAGRRGAVPRRSRTTASTSSPFGCRPCANGPRTSRSWSGVLSISSRGPSASRSNASRPTMGALQRYSWPGNIRELRNLVERAMIVASSPRLTVPVPAGVAAAAAAPAQRRAGRHRARSHPADARDRRMARPWHRRRGRTARAQAQHARNAHGQARRQAAGTMTSGRCRRNSAIAISINGSSVRK